MFDLACFTSNQVYAWQPGFDKNNLVRWVQKGLLVKLRNGHYSFPEYLEEPNFNLFVANRIYRPSYISLHTALSFYGLIPESVVQTTSVTSLKTSGFQNKFGTFSYQKIKPELMFGYDHLSFFKGRTLMMAKPEKALLDLLYLYPFYKTEEELIALRLDEDMIHESVNTDFFMEYAMRFGNQSLDKRAKLLLKSYYL